MQIVGIWGNKIVPVYDTEIYTGSVDYMFSYSEVCTRCIVRDEENDEPE